MPALMNKAMTLLVAEDDPNDVVFLKMAFEAAGLGPAARFVSDGQEAMDYLLGRHPFEDRTRFPFPTTLVVDLKMPRMSGFELLEWLRQRPEFQTLSVVVLTGSNWQSDAGRALELGAQLYVTKPLEFKELHGVVEQLKNLAMSPRPDSPPTPPPGPSSQPHRPKA